MTQKFFQVKFVVKDLFLKGLGYYLYESNKPKIEFWLSDDLLVKQDIVPDLETGKYSDRIALFVVIKLSEQDTVEDEKRLAN